MAPRPIAILAAFATALLPAPACAQELVRSTSPWGTLQTRWFDIHYHAETAAWAQEVAPRLDAIRDAVASLVGYAPPTRTTVVVDDPYGVANGRALPLRGRSAIAVWTTPPGPTEQIGHHGGWADKLLAHEFGHVAHLTRPSRRPLWWRGLLPRQLPNAMVLDTPRWVVEGYATWIEGRVTGSGRPHAPYRAALLRQLALDGRLPSYGAMSSGAGYKGGSMAYLAGSAFFDWLVAQRGDTSMTLLFRRQTARAPRSFASAFAGVYGDSPTALYARFTAELTARAFALDSAITTAGRVTGDRLARLTGAWSVDVSRDGARVAIAGRLGGATAPAIVIVPSDTLAETDEERKARELLLSRDPQDVPAIRTMPRLGKRIARLGVRRGTVYSDPRFIDAAGTLVLVKATSVFPDGSQAADLHVWNTGTGAVRPLTQGARVREAAPSTDGARVAAVRCVGGRCSLVIIDVATRAIRVLAEGSPRRVFAQPHWSPDDRSLVAGVQEPEGIWTLERIDVATGQRTRLSPADGVDRHSARITPGGDSLVFVSERDGIISVMQSPLAQWDEQPRTRSSASAWGPVPARDGAIWYLTEQATGFDLRRVAPGTPSPATALVVSRAALAPVLPLAGRPPMPLRRDSVRGPVPYGIGPWQLTWLTHGTAGRDGLMQGFSVARVDPAERLSAMLSAVGGSRAAWTGGVATAIWRGTRPALRVEATWLEQRSALQWDRDRLPAATTLGVAGMSAATELSRASRTAPSYSGVSVFAGSGATADGGASRLLVSARHVHQVRVSSTGAVSLLARGAVGRFNDSTVARSVVGIGLGGGGFRADARWYRAAPGTPQHEQWRVGGATSPLTDIETLGQVIAAPALPSAILTGPTVVEYRATLPASLFVSGLLPGQVQAVAFGRSAALRDVTAFVSWDAAVSVQHLGLIGLPGMQVAGGAAFITHGPLRQRASGWVGFRYLP